MLNDENALERNDILSEIGKNVIAVQEALQIPFEIMCDEASAQKYGWDDSAAGKARKNMWLFRVAKYLAYCTDGGLLGPRFSLESFATTMI